MLTKQIRPVLRPLFQDIFSKIRRPLASVATHKMGDNRQTFNFDRELWDKILGQCLRREGHGLGIAPLRLRNGQKIQWPGTIRALTTPPAHIAPFPADNWVTAKHNYTLAVRHFTSDCTIISLITSQSPVEARWFFLIRTYFASTHYIKLSEIKTTFVRLDAKFFELTDKTSPHGEKKTKKHNTQAKSWVCGSSASKYHPKL